MMRAALLILCVLLNLLSSAYGVTSVQAIFIFGDSIFDAGNNHYNKNCTAQADFPPYGSTFFRHPTGRFTNGRTVADFISQFVGIPLQKPYMEAKLEVERGSAESFPSNGINFASAGSGILRATNSDWGITPLEVQLQQFQSLIQQNLIPQNILQESLFLLESGSNDIFVYFSPFNTPTLDSDSYVQSMINQVGRTLSTMYKLGARKIAVFGLGPVGCVPARALFPGVHVNRCYGRMNRMVKNYNMALENMVKRFLVASPGAAAVYGDVYNIVQEFRENPHPYGFTDVTSACCGFGTLGGELQCGKEGYKMCNNPGQYLFWDFFHPTEHTNKLISKDLWAGHSNRIRPINVKNLVRITRPTS